MTAPTFFNFFNYLENPIVQYVMSFYKDKIILTEKDCIEDIMKLKHSRYAYENKRYSFIGDSLRLYYAAISDDFLYIDADCLVNHPEEIKMDCACYDTNIEFINEGGYFRANKNTQWVRELFNLYQNVKDEDLTKSMFWYHENIKSEIKTQTVDFTHFYVNFLREAPNTKEIFYTYNTESDFNKTHFVFDDRGCIAYMFKYRVFHMAKNLPLDVFKEQLKYTLKRDDLIFTEIN